MPSKTRERSTTIDPIPDLTIGFASPNSQSFRDKILQNLRENIVEIFDGKLVNFKA